MKVFISHSFEDSDKFDDLCFALERDGIPFWNPSQMPAGAPLRERLRMAIKECAVCVFIVTQNSLKSGWCQAEIGAFWGAGKPVVIYKPDTSVTEDSLPEQFKGDIYATAIRKVLHSVKDDLDEANSYVQLSYNSKNNQSFLLVIAMPSWDSFFLLSLSTSFLLPLIPCKSQTLFKKNKGEPNADLPFSVWL